MEVELNDERYKKEIQAINYILDLAGGPVDILTIAGSL